MRCLLPILLLLVALPVAAQGQMEIITLKHRTLEQVLPVLQPLLERGGSLSGMNDRLILRASAANRAEIRQALAAIDTPVRSLMISVRHDNTVQAGEQGLEASGSIGSGALRIIQPGSRDTRGTVLEAQRGDDSVRVRSYSTRGAADARIAQQVRVIEGGRAYIQIGSSLPLPLRQVRVGPGGISVSETVVYRDLGSGFYARPRLSGDQVTLEISPQQESLSTSMPGAIDSHQLSTTVSGRLGQWIPLGGTVSDETRDSRGGVSYSTRGNLDRRQVMLKVDEIP